jgi:Tol biopolymer transport system component
VTSQGREESFKLSIVVPSDSPVDSFAVSPDGRMLAFTAIAKGEQCLWVRSMDALESRPLPRTEGALYPFWSPDSRSIGFFAYTKLKRVDVAGGPPRELADVVVGRGAAWSSSGVILFCPRPLGPLHQVLADGGESRAVTRLDAAAAEAVHGFPQFLPDGRHFIYFAMSARAAQSAIRVGSLDSSASKALLHADASAVYARVLPGLRSVLVFVSAGTLMAQRLDLERMQMEGERIVLATNVRYRRWYQAKVSIADSGLLLYQEGTQEQHRFSWINRDGTVAEAVGPANDAISFTLSPDERHVAFYRDSDPATLYPKVWAMDLARHGAMFRVSDSETPAPDLTPIWSPDGREILYSRGDDRSMCLVRQALTGGAAVCVLDSPGPKFPTDWSTDGRFVAYTSLAPDFRYLHVWTADLAAKAAHTIRAFLSHSYREASASFSPSSDTEGPHFVAYASAETGRDEIYVCDFPDGARKWHVSPAGGLMPHWRRDGRELFYLALDGTLMVVPTSLGERVEIGVPHALFATGIQFIPQHKTWMNQYAVGRNGERFLINGQIPGYAHHEITIVVPQ